MLRNLHIHTILDLDKTHKVQLKAIRTNFETIRRAVDQRETALITLLNENYKQREKHIKKQMKLLNCNITTSNKVESMVLYIGQVSFFFFGR